MEEKKIDINISEEVAEGVYSNGVIIAHSTSEFVLDFMRIMPGIPQAKVKSRVILSPEHAKRLLISLQENLRGYEANFGTININVPPIEARKTIIKTKGEA